MLRCLVVLLALVLLLGGCSQTTTEPPAPTESMIPQTPPVTGIYMPDSAIENATDGAIQAFRLSQDTYHDCVMLGDDLLLMHTDGDDGILTLYRGETLQPVREIRLMNSATPTAQALQINEQGFGYFDTATRNVFFFNYDLQMIGQVAVPETLQGNAWLAPDWKNVYYCTQQGIYVMDLQTGISRLLREQTAVYQQITGGFGNGDVIRCEMELENGQTQILMIDGQTGILLESGAYLETLMASGEQYYLTYHDRGVDMIRYGTGENHRVLWPAEDTKEHQMLFENKAIVMLDQTRENTTLTYYDLQTGLRKAAITLEGISQVWGVQGDGKGGVWLYAGNATQGRWLYHWDCSKSPTEDETVYTAPYYTAENPDAEGLSKVQDEANKLGDKFGIDIIIWESAAELDPDGYTFTAEYLTQIYEYYLPKIDKILSIFPKEIYSKSASQPLQLALVRSITGDVNQNTLPSRGSMQFWNKDMPFVVVTLGENFEYELLRSFYLHMETRLLSKTNALYEWYRINPAEFFYDEDYVDNYFRTDLSLLEGDTPYFIDKISMSFAREDRASIFAYACMEEGEGYFKTPILQEKLKRICKGIREAYGLKKVTTQFLWEQYKA